MLCPVPTRGLERPPRLSDRRIGHHDQVTVVRADWLRRPDRLEGRTLEQRPASEHAVQAAVIDQTHCATVVGPASDGLSERAAWPDYAAQVQVRQAQLQQQWR